MTRVLMNMNEIQNEIQNRLNQVQEIVEDGMTLKVLGIQALNQLDESGCNWSAEKFSNSRGYESDILRVVAEVKAFANLCI